MKKIINAHKLPKGRRKIRKGHKVNVNVHKEGLLYRLTCPDCGKDVLVTTKGDVRHK